MKNEAIAVIGWIALVQGALGFAGRVFGDEPWGLLQKWWDIPNAGYIALFAVGVVLAFWGEGTKAKAKSKG
ncbi:hypothetical protein [Streptomyces sp. NPDC090025]|uniref:hypothetical protein n=1 Tax=Streptomyces sp. NPDC090025 TaxID=3365922 RepID=UPI00383491AD